MSIEEWTAAFTAAQKEFPPITKRQEAQIDTKGGGSYSYSYADLTEILDAVVPILNKHGLSLSQSPVYHDGLVGVMTAIFHTSGQTVETEPLLLPAGNTAQSAGSAITYARRYALTAVLGISPGEDDDGHAAPEEPVRVDYDENPGAWLANAVQMFGQWDPDQRRAVYKGSMEECEVDRLETMEQAKRVLEHMAEAYHRQHPDEAPF
jgi:hypothetical protein